LTCAPDHQGEHAAASNPPAAIASARRDAVAVEIGARDALSHVVGRVPEEKPRQAPSRSDGTKRDVRRLFSPKRPVIPDS
jgi:hypothetical protein